MYEGNILVVDDEESILRALSASLRKRKQEVTTYLSPREALVQLKLKEQKYSVIIVDYNLPEMNGLDFIDQVKKLQPDASLVLISGDMDLNIAQKAINQHNVRHVLTKPWKMQDLLDVVDKGIDHYQHNVEYSLMQSISAQLNQITSMEASLQALIQKNRQSFMDGLISVLGARDTETKSHSRRVAAYAKMLGKAMYLSDEQLEQLEIGSLLHDIGKMGVPDAILLKPGKLDEKEWQEMQRHPQLGLQIINGISWLEPAGPIIGQHHERYDGKGYPSGAKGEQISILARIFSVVDTMDAITSDRPYRNRLPFSRATQVVSEERGKQFDPDVVDAFLRIPKQVWEKIRIDNEDSIEELEALGVKKPHGILGFIDEE